jgi:hypothetical protein
MRRTAAFALSPVTCAAASKQAACVMCAAAGIASAAAAPHPKLWDGCLQALRGLRQVDVTILVGSPCASTQCSQGSDEATALQG